LEPSMIHMPQSGWTLPLRILFLAMGSPSILLNVPDFAS
jgi:hypothetical protein